MLRSYAGVGSRETPLHIGKNMQDYAERLAKLGYVLYSGGAKKKKNAPDSVCSADKEFEIGCAKAMGHAFIIRPEEMRSHVPVSPIHHVIEMSEDQFDIAVEFLTGGDKPIIPWWDKMDWYAQMLHARNYWQIVNQDCSFVDFVVAYSPLDSKGDPTGGTRTALLIAKRLGIQTYNLENTMDQVFFEEFLKRMEKYDG